MSPEIALVTCADLPELEDDDRLVIAPLAARGLVAEPVVWDDPGVDWDRYALAVLRSPWDYATRRDEFVAWARSVPRLANPAGTVEWNTDKRYLAELSAAGVPVVPTGWVQPGDEWTPPAGGTWVVKPTISAGSLDTGRYQLADPAERAHAVGHVRRLRAAGRPVMVQPYLDAVDTYGETALVFVGGRDSHAIRKGPMLDGPDLGATGLYKPEEISAREATAAERAVADRTIAAIPGGLAGPVDPAALLYARVDVIPGPDGAPVLVELELTEPSLFLAHAAGAADRLASAIASSVRAMPWKAWS